jgi:ribosomal protein L11 methyltransferase
MIELFPEGFEEVTTRSSIELAAYTDAYGEERLWDAFGATSSAEVEEGWDQRWRDFHRPVSVGPIWVGPPWATPPPSAVAVVVEPGRAFGTGSHPTTRMCLRHLLRFDRGAVLDVGSGSGVVAVTAAKLGLGPVVAFDHDPAAVEATRSNAAANDVTVDARLGDALEAELPVTEVAVVNISLEAVLAVAPRVSSRWLVTSGYLVSERPDPSAYRRIDRLANEGWAADLFERATQ